MTPQQLTLPTEPPPMYDRAWLVLQRTLTTDEMALVDKAARDGQCSRVVAYERLRREGRL